MKAQVKRLVRKERETVEGIR